MKFICGCDSNDEYVRNYHPHVITVNGAHVRTSKHFNRQGQEICPIHGKAGAPTITKKGPQGNEVPDFEAEYHMRYGSVNPRRPLGTNGVADRRDNRDPEAVFNELYAHGRTITIPTDANAFPDGTEIKLIESSNGEIGA